ncbi:hypothetical protein K4K59_008077 [Colletotrichum sp. SAR11_240]|nr:hypothetical protein K4K59_008077 [Colletotrichum sp. SAR11_240]
MEDKGPLIIAACWAFTGLSLLFVAARLFVRLAVYNKLMSDDYWIILSTICACSPPSAAWNFDLPRNCVRPKVIEGLAFWASSWSAFLDFYLAIYPAVVLWRLQMSIKKKIGLTIALGMGVISGCVGIVKTTGIPTFLSEDVSYELCEPLYWTSIEGNLIIIAACIPILGPLLEMFKGRPIWRTDKSSSNRQYEDYSKQSTQKQQDAIELRTIRERLV